MSEIEQLRAYLRERATMRGLDANLVIAANGKPLLRSDLLALLDRLEAAEAKVARVEALANEWATQATDYDEDTEQQIEDGERVLYALDGGTE